MQNHLVFTNISRQLVLTLKNFLVDSLLFDEGSTTALSQVDKVRYCFSKVRIVKGYRIPCYDYLFELWRKRGWEMKGIQKQSSSQDSCVKFSSKLRLIVWCDAIKHNYPRFTDIY